MSWIERERTIALAMLGIAAILIAAAVLVWLLVGFALAYLIGMIAWLLIIFACIMLWNCRRTERRAMDRIGQ